MWHFAREKVTFWGFFFKTFSYPQIVEVFQSILKSQTLIRNRSYATVDPFPLCKKCKKYMLAHASSWRSAWRKRHFENQSSALQCSSCFSNSYKMQDCCLAYFLLLPGLFFMFFVAVFCTIEKGCTGTAFLISRNHNYRYALYRGSSVPLPPPHIFPKDFRPCCGFALVSVRIRIQDFWSMHIRIRVKGFDD